MLGRKQQLEVARSFPNRYLFSYTNKVTSLFSIRYNFIINYNAIQLQLLDNLVAIASQFAAIAQITCVTKARNDVFMLVHAGVDGRTPDGGFLVGKCLFDVFNAFG